MVLTGKTSRQRALDRQRDGEIREKKLAEEKRQREEKRLADEAARKKAIKDRKVFPFRFLLARATYTSFIVFVIFVFVTGVLQGYSWDTISCH